MASLNLIVSEIVHILGDPNNYALRSNIRNSVIHTRNELIRRSYENHGYIDAGLQQKYKVQIEKVINYDDIPEGLEIPDELLPFAYKTVNKVHRPVRLINNLPFIRVSTPGYFNSNPIPYIKESNARFRRWLPGMRGQSCYDYINDYIYIFFNDVEYHTGLSTFMTASLNEHCNSIVIQGVFEKPIEVQRDIDSDNKYLFDDDDDEWFIPEDMIGQLKEIILKREVSNVRHENDETPNTIKMN